MPKNTKGGKGYKKRKSKTPAGPGRIMHPDNDQLYGIVLKRLGSGWVNLVVCDNDGANVRKVLGRIRGILRKRRVPFFEGSYVIACGRPFEPSACEKPKVDVIHRYYDEHVRILLREGRIPPEMKRELSLVSGLVSSTDVVDADYDSDDAIVFEYENERGLEDADINDL